MYSLILWWYSNLLAFFNKLKVSKISKWQILLECLPIVLILYFVRESAIFFVINNKLIKSEVFIIISLFVYLLICLVGVFTGKTKDKSDLLNTLPLSNQEILINDLLMENMAYLLIGGLLILSVLTVLGFKLKLVLIGILGIFIITFLLGLFKRMFKVRKSNKIYISKNDSKIEFKLRSKGKSIRLNEERKISRYCNYYSDHYFWLIIMLLGLLILFGYAIFKEILIKDSNLLMMIFTLGIILSCSLFNIFGSDKKYLIYYRCLPVSINRILIEKMLVNLKVLLVLEVLTNGYIYLISNSVLVMIEYFLLSLIALVVVDLFNSVGELSLLNKINFRENINLNFWKLWHYIGVLGVISLIVVVLNILSGKYLLEVLLIILLILSGLLLVTFNYYFRRNSC